jgi:hypothetical protein
MDRDEVIEKIVKALEDTSNQNLSWWHNQMFEEQIEYNVDTETFEGED